MSESVSVEHATYGAVDYAAMTLIRDITVPVRGGEMRAALALPDGPPADAGGRPALLVLHELGGLNEDIRRIALRFADNGYVALAPDLYSVGPLRPICIRRTMQSLDSGKGRVFADLEAAQRHLAGREDVDGARLGVAGFCMGGSFAILHAVRAPVGAAAVFYGRAPRLAEDMEGICPVVAGYGGRDRAFVRQPDRLRAHLDQLNVAHDIKVYPEAGHSYMNRRRAPAPIQALLRRARMAIGYDPEAAEDSWRRMLAFFGEHLAADAAGAVEPPAAGER